MQLKNTTEIIYEHQEIHCTTCFIPVAAEPWKRKDVQNLLFKMEDVAEAIVETLENVNEVIMETAEDVKDFAVEKKKDFKEAVIETEANLVKSVELAGSKLEKMKETKMEEMVEEVKPRLRRETFENSFLLNRVGGRQFFLELLVIAQVMMQTEMLDLMFMLTKGLMISVQTIVILLMLGLLFLGAPPAASPVPVADPGFDWLRFTLIFIHHVIYLITPLDHHDLHQAAAESAGAVHHPPPHLASCKRGGKTLSRRQEVIF